jgi:hypothetical protein
MKAAWFRWFVCAALVSCIAGCNLPSDEQESESSEGPNNEDLVRAIFSAGMSWKSKDLLEKRTASNTIQVDETVTSPNGGTIHVIGSVNSSISYNDSGYVTGGFMQIGLTETINSYVLTSGGERYTMNGAPYVSLAGTFTIAPGGRTFGTASSIRIGGGVRVTGNGLDRTININLTIIVNSSGTGGSVSGTIGGESVYFTF